MKRKLFYLLVLVSMTAMAQDAQIAWQNLLGGSGGDNPRSLDPTSDGGCIIAGRSFSSMSGDKTEDSLGEDDFWITKIDVNGVLEWENTIGGSLSDEPTVIRQLPDGTYIVAGNSSSPASGDKSESSLSRDLWVMRLDSNGTIIWEDTIIAEGFENRPSLVLTEDGGFLIGVLSDSGVSGDKTDPSKGATDYWIIKMNVEGDILWQNTIGSSGGDEMTSVDSTSDGGFILGGFSSGPISGDKTEPSKGGLDYWIVRTDSDGNVMWDKTFGGNDQDILSSVFETADGGFILGGASISNASGDKSEDNIGDGEDYWVIKTDSAGNIIWENTIGGDSNDAEGYTIPLLTGGYLTTGWSFSGISGDKEDTNANRAASTAASDLWIVQLNESGVISGQETLGGSENELNFIADTSPNPENIFVFGSSSSDSSGDVQDQNNGGIDIWVAKLEGVLGLSDVVLSQENMYPIPAKNRVFYTGAATSIEKLSVIGVDGKVYTTLKNPNLNNGIDISTLSSGIYFIQLQMEGSVASYKIIKQ